MNDRDLAHSIPEVSGSPANGETIQNASAEVVDVALLILEASQGTPGEPIEAVDGTSQTSEKIAYAVAEAANNSLPPPRWKFLRALPSFWHDRLIEAGLILS